MSIIPKIIGYDVEYNAYEAPFEIEATKGTHDINNCDGCKKNLAQLIIWQTEKYKGSAGRKAFPNCCEHHKNLVNIKQFKKKDFDKVPEMTARKIMYTKQHIINNIDSVDWYKEITDYIEWVIMSFGQMPKDCGSPLLLDDYYFHINHVLKSAIDVDPIKIKKLKDFIEPPKKRNKNNSNIFGLNVLVSTYQKWVKLFPFDLEVYFGGHKDHFFSRIQILKEKPVLNKYSGMSKAQLHTKESLFEALTKMTNDLLTKMNGTVLYEKGLITDAVKLKLDLIISDRKLKVKEGYDNSSPFEERRYVRMIKDWFRDEKKFIDEIAPLIINEKKDVKSEAKEKVLNISPVFKPELVSTIYEILKDFFNKDHQPILKGILETGGKAHEPLVFLDNGNRLADAFKQLIKSDIITGCKQKELESWICKNFKYRYRNKTHSYTPRYLNDIISARRDLCQNPVLNVSKDKSTGSYHISKV